MGTPTGQPGPGPERAAMAVRGITFLLTGLLLGGYMQATWDPVSDASFTARDRNLPANAPRNSLRQACSKLPRLYPTCVDQAMAARQSAKSALGNGYRN
jgi:hypothetical protein